MSAVLKSVPDSWENGDWMQTYLGGAYHPIAPRAEDVHIEDIAHALSMQCRYGGHVDRFYCVAEHSYWTSYLVPEEHALAGLVHDASEGYLIDIPRPAKKGMPDYRRIEDLNWRAICARFGWNPVLPKEVHAADNALLFSERAALMKRPPGVWSETDPGFRIRIAGWSPRKAEKMFLRRYRELTGQPNSLWDRLMLVLNNKKLLKETQDAPDWNPRKGAVR